MSNGPFTQRPGLFGVQPSGVSAGSRSRVNSPPGNPQLWWDFTDASTVWQDAGATMPAGEGDNVGRIDNKGNDAFLLFLDDQDNDFLVYREGVVNGLNVVDGQPADYGDLRNREAGNISGPDGMTMAWVTRLTSNLGSQGNLDFAWNNNPAFNPRLDWDQPSGQWQHDPLNISAQPLRAVSLNEWVWIYGSAEDNNFVGQASGSAPVVTSSGTYGQTSDGVFNNIRVENGQTAEIIVWDVALQASDLAELVLYFNERYGVLPRIDG